MSEEEQPIIIGTPADLCLSYEKWLLASYAYYAKYESIMADYEWDMLGRGLSQRWEEWDHPDKYLVEKDQMFTGFNIDHYPDWVPDRLLRDYNIV